MNEWRKSLIEADLVLVATFFLGADDLVAVPLRPGDLIHRPAHGTLMHHDIRKSFRAGFRRRLARTGSCPSKSVFVLVLLLLDTAAAQCKLHLPLAPLALTTCRESLASALCRCCFSSTLLRHQNQVSGDAVPY